VQKWYGAAGARIDFQQIEPSVTTCELQVHKADGAQFPGESRCDFEHSVLFEGRDGLGRVNLHRVAAVDACRLDVFQESARVNVGAIGDDVKVDLGGVVEEAIKQQGVAFSHANC